MEKLVITGNYSKLPVFYVLIKLGLLDFIWKIGLDGAYQNGYTSTVNGPKPKLQVLFYKTNAGNEPVRKWLKRLPPEERKTIGEDIMTVQFGWLLGMPLVDSLGKNLYEVRTDLENRIARVFFT